MEILSAKLCELDERISGLHSRISSMQAESLETLAAESARLRQTCAENEQAMRARMQNSRAAPVRKLAGTWTKIEDLIQTARLSWEEGSFSSEDADEKALLAEYVLDFALLAADHALLLSLEAIAAQGLEKEEA